MDNRKIIMNEELINKRWNYTRNKLKKFQKWYSKLNKKTQDKIQEIVNYYDISYNDLNKTIKLSDKERLNRKIEEWKELGIYEGYFKYRVEELNKYNMNYHNLIEILIYGIFMEELQSIDTEINKLFQSVSQDCYNEGRNDLRKSEKKISHSFLDTFSRTLIDGIVFADYLNALYLTNMQEIQKQHLISLQQNKKLNVYSDLSQRQFEKQRNRLICTNNDKFSGGLDKYVTALGNMAYIEASDQENQQVKLVSDHCDNVTDMCSYMDGMIFNTRKRNVFKRPMGKTKKDLLIQEVDVMGLVVGINQPPISEHFHWCHSILTYLINKSADELRETLFEDNIIVDDFEGLNKNIEHLIIYNINTDEKLHQESSNRNNSVGSLKALKLLNTSSKNSLLAVHNHPSNSSFSYKDLQTFNKYKSLNMIVVKTDNYLYYLKKNGISKIKSKDFEKYYTLARKDYFNKYKKNKETLHLFNKMISRKIGWKYGRKQI